MVTFDELEVEVVELAILKGKVVGTSGVRLVGSFTFKDFPLAFTVKEHINCITKMELN